MTVSRDHDVAATADVGVVEFRVLGPLKVYRDGHRLELGGVKQRTVLAILLSGPGRVASVDRLIEATWGEAPPEGARRSLQTYVSNLRRLLGGLIERDGDGYRIDTDRSNIDALWVEDEIAAARTMVDEPVAAAERLRAALAKWRGRPYDDIDGITELQAEISRLTGLRELAREERIEADLAAGRHRQLIVELDGLTSENHRARAV